MSGLVIFVFSGTLQLYVTWRHIELSRISHLVHRYIREGYIFLDSNVSKKEKEKAWTERLSPVLKKYWDSYGFNPKDIRTYPTGKCYHLTYQSYVEGLPRLFSRNYQLQAMVSYMLDPSLGLVYFGNQTHWKLVALAFPTWFIYLLTRKSIYQFCGVDQSWHIVNLIDLSNRLRAGEPKILSGHMDSGSLAHYSTYGIPCNFNPSACMTIEERILSMLTKQISIIIYCETPGDMGINEGSTGIFVRSHLTVIQSLHRLCFANQKVIDWTQWTLGVKNYCQELKVFQPDLPETKVLVIMGTLLHTQMVAKSLMNENVRVICNCKVYSMESESINLRMIRTIRKDAPLYQLASNPILFINDDSQAEFEIETKKLCNFVDHCNFKEKINTFSFNKDQAII